MKNVSTLAGAAVLAATLFTSAAASAAASVTWADWTAQTSSTHVDGTVAGVGVSYDGSIYFSQVGGGGDSDYWFEAPAYGPLGYTQQGVAVNRPTGTDIIALNVSGTKTITFDHAVTDVYLALASWNGNVTQFSSPFSIVSQGCGVFGCGSFLTDAANTGFIGSGEVHGVLKFTGTFTSLTIHDSGELWHGFTVGVGESAAAGGVPEPASWALLIAGFGGMGAVLRRRRALLPA